MSIVSAMSPATGPAVHVAPPPPVQVQLALATWGRPVTASPTVAPVTSDGDVGVVFLHNEGYSTMCGHGIIGLVTVGIECGLLSVAGPAPVIRIDTPAGRVTATAHLRAGDLEDRFEDGDHVTPEAILEAGLIRNLRHKVKVLGEGELKKKLKVEAARFSKSAEEKIKAAGGEAVVA